MNEYVSGNKPAFIEQIECDSGFGQDIMKAANIKIADARENGIVMHVGIWLSKGEKAGPVFCFFGNFKNDIRMLWTYKVREPRIYQSTLKKALPIFDKTKYSGPVILQVFVSNDDGKVYGIKWITTLTEELLFATAPLLKSLTIFEWVRQVVSGCAGEWTYDEFHTAYSGRLVNELVHMNNKLTVLRSLGFEVPLSSINQKNQVLEALVYSACEHGHFHPQKSQETFQES